MAAFRRIEMVFFILFITSFIEAKVEIMPLSEIRPGMEGYGLTVFQGQTPVRFKVKIIGILRQFLPKQDLILVRCKHPLLERAGIIAGMSGSPIYIKGRLIGALAYGWMFAKDPIAGVTPIENMLSELQRPLKPKPRKKRVKKWGSIFWDPIKNMASRDKYWSFFRSNNEGFTPAITPLFVSGLHHLAFSEIAQTLEPYRLVPIRGGGQEKIIKNHKRRLRPGDPIGIQFLRGDMNMTAIGTVTYIHKDKILAFGHPMLNIGEQQFPVVGAKVYTVIPSLRRSVKISSPTQEIGTLLQDRQSCIIAQMNKKAKLVPFDILLKNQTINRSSHYHMEMVKHRFLTPLLTYIGLISSLAEAESDLTDIIYNVNTSLYIKNNPPLFLEDVYFSEKGIANPQSIRRFKLFRAMYQILLNPFESAEIERVKLKIKVKYAKDIAFIYGAYIIPEEVEPGQKVDIYVRLKPYEEPEEIKTIPVKIPYGTAGKTLQIEVSAGNLVALETASPESLKDIIHNLSKGYPANTIVVTLKLPSKGMALRGHVVYNLPRSLSNTMKPLHSTLPRRVFPSTQRVIIKTSKIIFGRQSFNIKVKKIPS